MSYLISATSNLINSYSFLCRWVNLCLFWTPPNISSKTIKKDFTFEEKKEHKRLHEEICSVAHHLHIPSNTTFSVEILDDDSDLIGIQSNLFLRTAKIFISKKYFESYQQNCALKEEQEWDELQDEIPDDPIQLGRYLDQADPALRSRIHQLADKHILSCKRNEMQGIIAHELGHAKHFHTHQIIAISTLFLYTTEKLLSLLNNTNPIQTSLGLLCCAAITYKTAFGFSFPMANHFYRHCETEADRETAVTPEYLNGCISFFKKKLIDSLKDVPSGRCEEHVKKKLEKVDSKTHPNTAKRIQNLIQLRGLPYQIPSLIASIGKAVIISIPCLLAARDVINFFQSIF